VSEAYVKLVLQNNGKHWDGGGGGDGLGGLMMEEGKC